jgi:hypothetical protein
MQVTSNGRVRRTEGEWRELIARWRKSGLSAREFCRQEKLQASSFQRWQARLNGASDRKEFITVLPTSREVPAVRPWVVEVTLPDGSQLRFQG